MTHELTHLDLFSGIGGFALGAGRAGFRTVAFSEVDPYACRVLAERWPEIPNLGDVRKPANFAGLRDRITVITGGFPCQPVSEAGEQRGANDVRWLWPATAGVLEVVRAPWFIGENVTGLINMGLLDEVCSDLERLGYSTQSFTIPASAAGAWHVRERVWILAHLAGVREPQPQGSEREVRGWDFDCGQTPGITRGLPGTTRQVHADVMRPGSYAGPLAGLHSGQEGAGTWHEYLARLFQWPAESPLVRMVHGIPHRAHRIKGLGNAIVPQIPEAILGWIAQIEQGTLTA